MERIVISYIPEIELEINSNAQPLSIKGKQPEIVYGFTFFEIYAFAPACDILTTYNCIRNFLLSADRILRSLSSGTRNIPLLPSKNKNEAQNHINALFSAQKLIYTSAVDTDSSAGFQDFNLFSVRYLSPFPLKSASREKLIDSLLWIDANIKIQIESVTSNLPVSKDEIRLLVKTAFEIFSYLLKAEDYFLARNISFNYSMFLQERIIELMFDGLSLDSKAARLREGSLSNKIAVDLLHQFTDVTFHKLIRLSAFMGVAWADIEQDTLRVYANFNPEPYLNGLEQQLDLKNRTWGINHFDMFLSDLHSPRQDKKQLIVILDDNGESVFDLALIQMLMHEYIYLEVTFVVNYFPVSNNISLPVFLELMENNYFKNLKAYFLAKRARLAVERQAFRSFETDLLSPETRMAIRNADILYIKGANFFETFQFPDALCYFCFTVYGLTSQLLTGCKKGEGVFARVPAGQSGYVYHDHNHIVSLKETTMLSPNR